MMPHPMQKAIGRLDMTAVFPRGLVTLSATNSRLNVRIASTHVACVGVMPGVGVNVGTVTFPSVGFKLQPATEIHLQLESPHSRSHRTL